MKTSRQEVERNVVAMLPFFVIGLFAALSLSYYEGGYDYYYHSIVSYLRAEPIDFISIIGWTAIFTLFNMVIFNLFSIFPSIRYSISNRFTATLIFLILVGLLFFPFIRLLSTSLS